MPRCQVHGWRQKIVRERSWGRPWNMNTPPRKSSMALPALDEALPRHSMAPVARERTESHDLWLPFSSSSLQSATDDAPFMPVFEEEVEEETVRAGVAEERRSIRSRRLPLVAQVIRPQFLSPPIATSWPSWHTDSNGLANGESSRSPETGDKSSNSGTAKAARSSIRLIEVPSSDSLPFFPSIKDEVDDPRARITRPLLRMRRPSCQGRFEKGAITSSLHSSWVESV